MTVKEKISFLREESVTKHPVIFAVGNTNMHIMLFATVIIVKYSPQTPPLSEKTNVCTLYLCNENNFTNWSTCIFLY